MNPSKNQSAMSVGRTVITAKHLFNGSCLIDDPFLVLEDGCIRSISTRAASALPDDARILDYSEATIAPAFLDVHIHGAAGHDVMEATPDALGPIGKFLASHGTGSFLATTVTAPLDATLRAVSGLAKAIAQPADVGVAHPIGIHLEGPFVSFAKRGVQPAEHLLAPDGKVFDQLFEAAEGTIRLMTLAPELPGAAELIAHATKLGVHVSLGHSNATAAETCAAIVAGATSATHTFNAMRPLDHREPGILGAVLTDDAVYAELICDGVHTAPEAVRLWWRAKGPERAILVTDAMSATGMPDGEYRLGGFDVQLKDGRAMAGGVLAGSVLTLDRALANFLKFTGATVAQGLRLFTANPASLIGARGGEGSVVVGRPANLVVVDSDGSLKASYVKGRLCSAE